MNKNIANPQFIFIAPPEVVGKLGQAIRNAIKNAIADATGVAADDIIIGTVLRNGPPGV